MLTFDFSDPATVRIFYTSEDYVPASQKTSACGIKVDKWWVDTEQVSEERSVHTAIVRPWSEEQREGVQAARALAELFHKQNKRPATPDDNAWFDEQWWSAHPDQNPLYDSDVEKLHMLAFAAFLEAPSLAQKPAPRPAPAPPPPPPAPPPAAVASLSEVIVPPAAEPPPPPEPPPSAPVAPPASKRAPVKRAPATVVASNTTPAPAKTPAPAPPPPPAPPAPAPAAKTKGKKSASAPTPAPAPVAPVKVASKAVAPVPAKPAAKVSTPPQPRTAELDAVRKDLLAVLKMGGWGNEARLLIQLREKIGVNAIYSSSERRFVPLGYVR